ncbi:hypothetical protein [Cryptosporangium sp. NPDC048952]|uniref:hypothetical protein n=1 Tax=Cryptosporangium sp. NPDC048952 TaxID=3363961 RepID=UPI0037142623
MMACGEHTAQRDVPNIPPSIDQSRTESWILNLAAGSSALLDEQDDAELFLLLGIPPGAFTTCHRDRMPTDADSSAATHADLELLPALGLAHWTDPDEMLITPSTDLVHAAVGRGQAQLFLAGLPWIARPLAIHEELLAKGRTNCLFGVYLHDTSSETPANVYDAFSDQLFEGHAAVAEIRLRRH